MMQSAQAVVSILVFTMGACMGSFYNVLVDRLPNEQDVIRGRSECTECHTQLKWYDLVPIVSFLLLRGRCRYCKAKLSWRYLISELLMGGAFLLAFLLWGRNLEYMRMCSAIMLWSMLFVVGFMDYKYQIIIDQVLLVFTSIGVAFLLIGKEITWLTALLGGLTGLAIYGVLYIAARLVYRKEAFGFGDVLFLAAIGLFFGPTKTLITSFLSAYCFLAFIIILRIRPKKHTELPFAPAMCGAAFIVSLYGDQIISLWLNYIRYK